MSSNKDAAGAQGAQHESLIDIPRWVFDDGGRSAAGFKGHTGDCVTGAIAIATKKPYGEVYDAMRDLTVTYCDEHEDKVSNRIAFRGASPRGGVFRKVWDPYLKSLGWVWTPTMSIGSGCKVHLKADDLPSGRLVVKVSRHVVAVIDGVIHDTYDCSRDGTRCVYGYFAEVG
jgi:hypothetical protein